MERICWNRNGVEKLMKIQVIGEGCPDCSKLYEHTQEAVNNLGVQVEIEKVQDLLEIVKLGVMTAPSVMIDGKLVISGQVASVKKIEECIKKEM